MHTIPRLTSKNTSFWRTFSFLLKTLWFPARWLNVVCTKYYPTIMLCETLRHIRACQLLFTVPVWYQSFLFSCNESISPFNIQTASLRYLSLTKLNRKIKLRHLQQDGWWTRGEWGRKSKTLKVPWISQNVILPFRKEVRSAYHSCYFWIWRNNKNALLSNVHI